MSENLQAGGRTYGPNQRVLHCSWLIHPKPKAPLALVLNFFFDSLGDRFKKTGLLTPSPSSAETQLIYARDMTPQARILLSV